MQPRSSSREKGGKFLDWPSQSPDLNPMEHAFHLLKRRLKSELPQNKQQLKMAAVKSWQRSYLKGRYQEFGDEFGDTRVW